MNPRILIIAGVAVVILVIALVGAYFALFKSTEPTEDPAVAAAKVDTDGDQFTDVDEQAQGTDPNNPQRFPGSHKKVLVARSRIPANELIRDNMVDVKEVAARGEAPEAAILEQDRIKVTGHISALEIQQGDYIVDAMIYGGKPQLSFLVPRYKRAISLKYEQLAAVSGLVELGDLVDVIGHFRVRRREGGEAEYARILVQNARVIALGQRFVPKDPSDTSIDAPPTGLTLSVFPHEAERLIWSENYPGTRLVLAMRSPANDAEARTAGVTDNGVFGRDVLSDPRMVEVYYGGVWGGVTRFSRPDGDRMGLGRIEGSDLKTVEVEQR